MSIYDIGKYYDENMNEIDTKDMITTHLHIPSTPFENQWSGGDDGIMQRFAGAYAAPKTIEAHIFLKAYDYIDYEFLRDYLYGIFGFGKPFYVVSKNQTGKRHKVVLESDFMPERLSNTSGTVVIPFVTAESPYAESIGTTQIIDERGTLSDDELWGFGMGLIDDPDSRKYTHTGTTFKIYNAGNVPIHPFEQDLKIEITMSSFVTGSDELILKNNTNGSEFRTTENVSAYQNIVIDGPSVTSGGLNYLRNTTKEFIELSPGWNEFEINVQATVAFDFRYYYR